jgi:PAS domain S-box-containing protein
MTPNIKLLLICACGLSRNIMACALAKSMAPEGINPIAVSTEKPQEINPCAIEVMSEIGIDISVENPVELSSLKINANDIVITLCNCALESCPAKLPGQPPTVNWNIEIKEHNENVKAEKLEAFRNLRDNIRHKLAHFFDDGYFSALCGINEKFHMILDSLHEGIIAHDMMRNIIYFNGAAEAITGYSKQEVIGRDCHTVFPDNFCGKKCSFCEGEPAFDNVTYPIDTYTKNGEPKQLEMSVQAIRDDNKRMHGVLASFRDLTLENQLARRLEKVQSFSGIIGRDKKMLEIFDLIKSVSNANVPVLIQGASGTGKELVAAAIHNEATSRRGLFVPVNCGALPEGLLESELFGHVRGAFTGAIRDKKGRFELADGGTIFLDEIGDISAAMQVKLLRVLQEGSFERVGGMRTINVNVRVISATNKDLKKEIAEGRFREDLYYRLCVVPINLPPLKNRYSDIPLLVNHFIKSICEENDRELLKISPAALDAMISYAWPGNIRELQNALQFALVKCRTDTIEVTHLPAHLSEGIQNKEKSIEVIADNDAKKDIFTEKVAPLPEIPSKSASPAKPDPDPIADVKSRGRNKLTEEAVKLAMEKANGNKAKAARILGVGRATLYRFISED